MTATTPNDVTTSDKIKPPRLGRAVAFGSEYGSGLTERAYIATACLPICMADGCISAEHAAAAAVRFADALLIELAK